jgi:hypothetical protein
MPISPFRSLETISVQTQSQQFLHHLSTHTRVTPKSQAPITMKTSVLLAVSALLAPGLGSAIVAKAQRNGLNQYENLNNW